MMGLQWNKKYTTIAAYTLIVILISMLTVAILWKTKQYREQFSYVLGIFMPFMIGGAFAYLINFILDFYEKWVFGRFKKHKRRISLLFSYFTVIVVILVILQVIVPQISKNVMQFVNGIPAYTDSILEFLSTVFSRFNLSENTVSIIDERLRHFSKVVTDFTPNIFRSLVNLAFSVTNMVIGFVVSIYILADKERFGSGARRMCFAILKPEQARTLIALVRRADGIFGRYIRGVIIDALIVGGVTAALMLVFRIPYAVLVGFLVGISNMIPYFGPFIGAIPSALIVFFASPVKALWFLILIVVVQQVDGNFIAPKVLGESIGLSPFWVLFSTLLFGKIFGIGGMVLGVPIFAFILTLVNEWTEKRLRQKSLPTDVKAYMD